MVYHYFITHSHNSTNIGCMSAVDYVFLGEKMSGRNHRSTNLVQSCNSKPELVSALHDEHHHIAALYAKLQEERSRLVAFALYVGKSELMHLPAVVSP